MYAGGHRGCGGHLGHVFEGEIYNCEFHTGKLTNPVDGTFLYFKDGYHEEECAEAGLA